MPGSANKSYGIHVAQLAGVPKQVTERATDILSQLESQSVEDGGDGSHGNSHREIRVAPKQRKTEFQLTLFETSEHPVVDEIRKFRIDEAAPLDALQQIKNWQDSIVTDKSPKPR